ncbi:kinesin-like protein KIN-UA isoform X2 [Physcomitrium patens]|uniref:kinesin-like protein KIN-UA isoform X2 n=1 Tax=Physcomitrium patens TaxID=3218 RepID=UPI000D174BFC|nr:kinesin-like protein KIN-UA isoform X2 [Physcomitrium patens]|eukprot:XP_024400296.1 kinesin-like protein KIN-UA isoform X2 [Physcomitrella patens]
MASISTVPIDKLLLDPSSVLRKPVNVISPKRRKCPRERFVQSMENLAIPLGQSEKRLRLYGAGGDGAMDSENATSSAERVRVTVRVRPPTRVEQREEDGPPFIFLDTEKNTVILRRRGSFMDFTEFQFDAVLPPTALQVDVYNMAARAVVLDVLNGYNGTIMAYGQTGAGKTYTLSDNLTNGGGVTSVGGIIPRSAAEIFDRAGLDQDYEFHVSMSYIQIYMEQIQDLLRPESCNMQIREGMNGVYVSGVEEVQVKSVEDTMKLLMLGDRHRCLSFTKLNAHSSRSHTIVILTVEKKAKYKTSEQKAELADRRRVSSCFVESERVLVGKLFLVDLAGSERLKKSGSEGIRASEAMSVNLSLTCLGKCISARADPAITHVPFRDSKLTRLLQESLGGNAKTSLVINIAPCSEYLQESMSSLHFGSRAMKLTTQAVVNVEEEFRVLTRNLQETVNLQDEKLQHLEDEQLVQAQQSLAEKARQVELLREEQNRFNHKFMEQLRVKDESWKNRLENVRSSATNIHQKRIENLQDELTRLKNAENQYALSRPTHVINNNAAKDLAAQIIQRAYKQHYVAMLYKEKKKLEVVVGYQLMANSAVRVLKGIQLLDELFTRKNFPKLSLR